MKLKDKDGKRYYILQGFEFNNENLVCGGANLESEVESQAAQLFEFIYRQIPWLVGNRLKEKLNKCWQATGENVYCLYVVSRAFSRELWHDLK